MSHMSHLTEIEKDLANIFLICADGYFTTKMRFFSVAIEKRAIAGIADEQELAFLKMIKQFSNFCSLAEGGKI